MNHVGTAPPTGQLALYGALALPVAMLSLPVYIHIPQFYGQTLGLSLASVGLVLLLVRLVDTVQDPLLGLLADRLARRGISRRRQIALGLPLLLGSLLLLVYPPADHALVWLAGTLILLYTAFSFIAINYYAYGAQWRRDYDAQSVISTWREAFVLLGILLASVAPQLLVNRLGEEAGYQAFGWLVAVLALAVALPALWRLPALSGSAAPQGKDEQEDGLRAMGRRLGAMSRNGPYRWLLGIFFLNGLTNAIPATLVLFYIGDVLRLSEQAGYFLGLYFLAGLAGMPLWLRCARVCGKKRCLMLSMVLASVSFIWAFTLGPGDAAAFYAICLISGACLGADMAMPPAMLGDAVQAENPEGSGGYFGIWNLMWKLSFALAAGLALPALAWMGYDPNAATGEGQGESLLAMVYALVPAAIKLVAAVLLYLSPLEASRYRDASHLRKESA